MIKYPHTFLLHILESTELIERYISGISKEDFLKSPLLQDAVIRRIEIIGEASRNLPSDFKDKYPRIPWPEISNMRNILVHAYFGIDLNLAWKTASADIPVLKNQIADILDSIS